MTVKVTKNRKSSSFITTTLMTKWSNLLKPDIAFGEGSANHNITVVVDADFRTVLNNILKTTGAKKINGLRESEGVTYFKAKSKVHVDQGVFPCVDSQGNPTSAVPFGGDKVRLKLVPMVLARDNSLSIYLNGIQVIEKNTTFNKDNEFAPVEGGFVGTGVAYTEEGESTIDDEDLPF